MGWSFHNLKERYHRMRAHFMPDIRLDKLEDLTPRLLKEQGIQAALFDLDDTLMPEFSGKFKDAMLTCLLRLHESGIEIGINTNNFRSSYCEQVRYDLQGRGLHVPFIENAYKPRVGSFEKLVDYFQLPPEQVAMVGDGIFTDTFGARRAGLLSVRVRWYSHSAWQRGTLLFLRELFNAFFDSIRFAVFRHSTMYHNFTEHQQRETGKETVLKT